MRGMARHTLILERDEAQCCAPCYNTNVFAPDAFKVTCDTCHGRRGYFKASNQWIDCHRCAGAGTVCCPNCHGSGRITL